MGFLDGGHVSHCLSMVSDTDGVSDAPLADLQIGVDDAGRYVIPIKQIANPKP